MYRDKIRLAYDVVKGDSYTYIDDVRKESDLSDDIFKLCLIALAQSGAIELLPGYEQWNDEKQAYQVGDEFFYGMNWIDTEGDKPAKKTDQTPAFERLFERVNEIVAIMECTQDKKKTVVIIKSEFPEFSDLSDNTIKTNITAFPFLCSQMREADDAIKQELTKEKQANESFKQESISLRQELNITLNNLETVRQDIDRKEKELTALNKKLNKVGDMDKLDQFIRQTEQKFVELNNWIKQIEAAKTETKQIKQTIKHRGLNNVGKWNVVESGGYYRAFRNIDGKNQGVYIGKSFTEEIARQKIESKGFPVD